MPGISCMANLESKQITGFRPSRHGGRRPSAHGRYHQCLYPLSFSPRTWAWVDTRLSAMGKIPPEKALHTYNKRELVSHAHLFPLLRWRCATRQDARHLLSLMLFRLSQQNRDCVLLFRIKTMVVQRFGKECRASDELCTFSFWNSLPHLAWLVEGGKQ